MRSFRITFCYLAICIQTNKQINNPTNKQINKQTKNKNKVYQRNKSYLEVKKQVNKKKQNKTKQNKTKQKKPRCMMFEVAVLARTHHAQQEQQRQQQHKQTNTHTDKQNKAKTFNLI